VPFGGGYRPTYAVDRTHDEVSLVGAFDFEPRSEHRFPFEVQLPRNRRISTANTNIGWYLAITMDIPMAIDPVKGVLLKVQPAKKFLAIIGVCEESLKFQAKSRYWDSRSSRTYFHLLPLKALRFELDYLDVGMVQEEDGGVDGELIFNLREKSIADYFNAFMKKDLITRHFSLASSQIFTQNGDVNNGEIAKVIGSVLNEVMEQRAQ